MIPLGYLYIPLIVPHDLRSTLDGSQLAGGSMKHNCLPHVLRGYRYRFFKLPHDVDSIAIGAGPRSSVAVNDPRLS
jgi:hypothetical protein